MASRGAGPFRPDWIAPGWRRLRAPMLAVIGSEPDTWGPLPEPMLAERLSNVPVLERATVSGAGHFMHIEKPHETARLVLDNIPAVDTPLTARLDDYLNSRGASFVDWQSDALIIATRFGDVDQLHRVTAPLGAREQLTFYREPVTVARAPQAAVAPGFAFLRDQGGNENAQVYYYESNTRAVRMLTGGSGVNGGLVWSHDGRRVAFHSTARDILATQPGWNNMLLHDPAGRQLVDASLPWGTPLLAEPVAPRSIEAAVRTLEPAIDDLARAPLLNGRLGIPVRVPVVRDGKAAYVLTAVMRPEAFQQVIGAQNMPSDWASGLVDGRGRLIARVPHRPPGTPASPAYLENTKGADEGWYRGATLDGTDTFTAFLRSELTGLRRLTGTTTLIVTHDLMEALQVADEIVVLDEGKIVQRATPRELVSQPATDFVARLVEVPRRDATRFAELGGQR